MYSVPEGIPSGTLLFCGAGERFLLSKMDTCWDAFGILLRCLCSGEVWAFQPRNVIIPPLEQIHSSGGTIRGKGIRERIAGK